VQEVIDTAHQVTGRSIAVVNCPRRAGDPARLVADSSLIREKLGWQPRYADLATIVVHAWAWYPTVLIVKIIHKIFCSLFCHIKY
jgi:UDP-glucose 4-epimerase